MRLCLLSFRQLLKNLFLRQAWDVRHKKLTKTQRLLIRVIFAMAVIYEGFALASHVQKTLSGQKPATCCRGRGPKIAKRKLGQTVKNI